MASPIVFAFVFQARAPMPVRGLVQSSELEFDHVLHVEDVEVACEDCHAGVSESTTGLDDLLPDKNVCADCHEVDDEEECGTCHTNVDEAVYLESITTYSEKFSHERHLTQGLECQDCHAAVLEPETSVGALPEMVACLDCHESKSVTQDCASCHMPADDLVPSTHTTIFLHTHGDLARADAHDTIGRMQCQTCHEQSFCQDCHEGDNLDRTTHPLNYEFTHALDARGAERNCASCHTSVSFCADCHAENQILPQNHRPGWTNTLDGGMHRLEAQRDLNSCITCHQDDADQTCGLSGCHESSLE